jgi:hypothetical protein
MRVVRKEVNHMNYIIFRAIMMKAASKGEMPETFVKEQFNLLKSGVRDVRIHDAACVAWSQCGGKW